MGSTTLVKQALCLWFCATFATKSGKYLGDPVAEQEIAVDANRLICDESWQDGENRHLRYYVSHPPLGRKNPLEIANLEGILLCITTRGEVMRSRHP